MGTVSRLFRKPLRWYRIQNGAYSAREENTVYTVDRLERGGWLLRIHHPHESPATLVGVYPLLTTAKAHAEDYR